MLNLKSINVLILFFFPGCHPVQVPNTRRPRSVPGDRLISGGVDSGAGGVGHHDQDCGQHGLIPGECNMTRSTE